MTSRRVRVNRFFINLITVAGCYFLFSLVIMFGAELFLNRYGSLLKSKQLLVGQLILGILLLIISQLMDSKKAHLHASERAALGGGQMLNWRKRIMGDKDSNKIALITLIGLVLTAVMLEIVTMLPYLAAIGLITDYNREPYMVHFYSSTFGLLYCNGTSCTFVIGRSACCSQKIRTNTC